MANVAVESSFVAPPGLPEPMKVCVGPPGFHTPATALPMNAEPQGEERDLAVPPGLLPPGVFCPETPPGFHVQKKKVSLADHLVGDDLTARLEAESLRLAQENLLLKMQVQHATCPPPGVFRAQTGPPGHWAVAVSGKTPPGLWRCPSTDKLGDASTDAESDGESVCDSFSD